MKKIFILIILICTVCSAQDRQLLALVSNVKKSIINMDSSLFTKSLSINYFDYFEGDCEVAPSDVDSNYFKLLPSGYYSKELTKFIKDRNEIITFFTSNGKEYPRHKCPVTEKSFSPLIKISMNRYEIIIMRYSEAFRYHLVFIKFKIGWKLSGSFFEAAHCEPCDTWNGNIWQNN
jgi:hypothetical protein